MNAGEMRYPIESQVEQHLSTAFRYHAPIGDQPKRYEILRSAARELAQLLCGSCPASRERSIALTKLEESIMWANASIARNETTPSSS
jgi:hypothetical protein